MNDIRNDSDDPVDAFLAEVRSEVTRARAKFPAHDNLTTIALFEEAGEVAKAVLEESPESVRKEAVQLAAMAVRLVLDGDHSTTVYRAERNGMGPLVAASEAPEDKAEKLRESGLDDDKFLADVVGVVDANGFEHQMLWEEYQRLKRPGMWVSNHMGYAPVVGHIYNRPICLSMWTAVIDGHKILFVDAVSQLVDHRLVDEWLAANLPATAFIDGRLNRTEAMNFHNVFPHQI